MSRAQEIKQKRLDFYKKQRSDESIDRIAKQLFDTVLDIFKNNPVLSVYLRASYNGSKIQIDYGYKYIETNVEFSAPILKKLADLFNQERDYTAKYDSGRHWFKKNESPHVSIDIVIK